MAGPVPLPFWFLMWFLNAALLAGAAALLVPLVIHLLNKRRVVTVAWGAMHLLQEALRQKKRNVRLEQLLLLIARICIPILLALCLARPVFTLLRQLPGMNQSSLVVVLDNSFSMRARGEGDSAGEQARSHLRRILGELPGGSDVSIILAGSPPRLLLAQPSTAMDVLTAALDNDAGLSGPADLGKALQMAQSELKRAGNAAREVLLISDFQQSDWRNISDGASLPALEALHKVEPKPLVTFFQVGGDVEENLSVASVEPSAFVVAKSQIVSLRTRVQNHGARSYQDIAVHLEADGARVRTTRISVAPEAETVLTLTHAFESAGDHSLTVRVEGDAFPEDNALSLVLPVREQVNCLVVQGENRSGAPLEGDADFLQIALSPHQSAEASLKDVIRGGIAEERAMRDQAMEGAEVVVLANVSKLNDRQLKDLEEFVKRGGGLLIFAGPSMDTKWYTDRLYQKGKGLLPCELTGFGHVEDGQPAARILSQRFTHPATTYFNDARGLRLQDAAFNHWVKFGKAEGEARTLLSLDRGDALLVEKPYGKGRVLAVASSANARWTNLPLQPAFVPLMQRLVTYLATQNTAPQYQLCGATLRAAVDSTQEKATFLLMDPLSRVHELNSQADEEGNVFVDYHQTFVPGVYELRSKAGSPSEPVKKFAFNLNPAESALATFPPEKVREMAGRLDASYAASEDEYARLDRSRRHGTELWQPILLLLLLFLFGEVFLQQRISRA